MKAKSNAKDCVQFIGKQPGEPAPRVYFFAGEHLLEQTREALARHYAEQCEKKSDVPKLVNQQIKRLFPDQNAQGHR